MSGSQRTLLITGASRGFGKAIAQRMLSQGWRVIGVSRSSVDLGEAYTHVTMDLGNRQTLKGTLPALGQQYGPEIDAVVLNAGQGRFGSLEEFSLPQIDQIIDLNLLAPLYLAKTFLPFLKRRPSVSDLVMIGSEAGLNGGRRGAVYAASKGGLARMANALRDECAKSEVRVSLVQPGMARTSFYEGLAFRPGDHEHHAIEPETMAETVRMILEAAPGAVFDEVRVSPLKKVLKFGDQKDGTKSSID